MSEPLNEKGCLLAGLCIVVIILIAYAAIDMWADRREEFHMRDLQRRVGQLKTDHK